jgi:CheY-like chemotaxis protein
MSALRSAAMQPHPLAVTGGVDAGTAQRPRLREGVSRRTVRPLVVVAEDRADARTMVGIMLASYGFDVVLAVDGLDALDAVLKHGPDAVVCDLEMPNLDGLGLCRALRALRANETLPIIVFTGADRGDPRLRDAGALHGAQVIAKSLAVTEVGEVLTRMIAALGGAAAA